MEPGQNLYDPKWVSEFYDQYGNTEWERLVRSPCAEIQFSVHRHYLEKHVPKGGRVLEIGPGPGRFTQVLVEMGCQVVAADISEKQLQLNKENAIRLGFDGGIEEWLQLDICDLSSLPDRAFDAVVAYGGPLSYVFEKRGVAIQQMKAKLKPDGTLLLSAMSTWGSVHSYLLGVLEIDVPTNHIILETGDLHSSFYPFATHFCHMFRSQELRELLQTHGLEVVGMSASHSLSAVWGDQLNEIRQDETKWNELVRMDIEASQEPGCLDMGTHIIAVARLPRG